MKFNVLPKAEAAPARIAKAILHAREKGKMKEKGGKRK